MIGKAARTGYEDMRGLKEDEAFRDKMRTKAYRLACKGSRSSTSQRTRLRQGTKRAALVEC